VTRPSPGPKAAGVARGARHGPRIGPISARRAPVGTLRALRHKNSACLRQDPFSSGRLCGTLAFRSHARWAISPLSVRSGHQGRSYPDRRPQAAGNVARATGRRDGSSSARTARQSPGGGTDGPADGQGVVTLEISAVTTRPPAGSVRSDGFPARSPGRGREGGGGAGRGTGRGAGGGAGRPVHVTGGNLAPTNDGAPGMETCPVPVQVFPAEPPRARTTP